MEKRLLRVTAAESGAGLWREQWLCVSDPKGGFRPDTAGVRQNQIKSTGDLFVFQGCAPVN